jgi:RNA polymerase sigma-70 factor (ECF subfamily)
MSIKAPEESAPLEDIAGALVANHRAFLSFVERRVGNRATAEEILQEAFVRSIDKLGDVRESAIGWFYRVLRNAITDHYRRAAAAERRNEAYAREVPDDDDELQQAACKCVLDLAKTLKPEYANALERVEVAGLSVKEYADEAGISSNNAGVRIFRAREALRKQVARSCGTCATHGCVDCSCSE